MSTPPREVIHTRIWDETAEPDNPFAAATCHCRGYDVYGDLLHKASFVEYLYLLLAGERPAPAQAQLLERLAIALANPDPSTAATSGGLEDQDTWASVTGLSKRS